MEFAFVNTTLEAKLLQTSPARFLVRAYNGSEMFFAGTLSSELSRDEIIERAKPGFGGGNKSDQVSPLLQLLQYQTADGSICRSIEELPWEQQLPIAMAVRELLKFQHEELQQGRLVNGDVYTSRHTFAYRS